MGVLGMCFTCGVAGGGGGMEEAELFDEEEGVEVNDMDELFEEPPRRCFFSIGASNAASSGVGREKGNLEEEKGE